ncbi:MocR-like pyridoxine biosynthesis transcription factor PdxR [Paenibacillus endoradicis]|uniref:MocR-like pyridoxine biosynthesis transcription factor PdxR n=1 Tax=Paenibacillus endoradicis TaxID=2972487 RepID=UPI002159A3E6|nr:PLP-dependent aminotransferase family protein [Paenibacillus endoradicis]MCR8658000.1 PLP-dependent aminotransferase family protein [Paenibacillus endoradicis]
MELYLPYDKYLEQYGHKSDALFQVCKDNILNGTLKVGSKMPSSREVATRYGLSRGTVNVVYEMLQSQGFVQSILGSGTYVVYDELYVEREEFNEELLSTDFLSEWGKRLTELEYLRHDQVTRKHSTGNEISFSLGQVDLKHFPMQDWNRLLFEQVRKQYDKEMGDAYSSDGHQALKEGIVHHLRLFRGIQANQEDIVIVNGSQQAITLAIQLLINAGDYVAMEDPHYVGARNAILSAGGIVHAFPIDREGMIFHPSEDFHYKLVMVTASRQFPTGAVLSMKRRLQLLNWAEENNSYIIEDDYDSEFQHYGRANEPLKSLDKQGRVIYMGTFSRTMMQDIRLGYVILPSALKKWFSLAKQVYERHPLSIIEQRALAQFMNTGLYDRHIRRMNRVYRRKAERLFALLTLHLSHVVELYPIESGLHIFVKWKAHLVQYELFLDRCIQDNLSIVDVRNNYVNDSELAFCLGFAHLTDTQIDDGVMRMKIIIDDVMSEEGKLT